MLEGGLRALMPVSPLQRKIQGFELRPILVIRRRRLSAILNSW